MSFKQSTKTHDDQLLQLPRDMDQDKHIKHNCAERFTGGWWYNSCYDAHPTGTSTTTKTRGYKYVKYYCGGERGTCGDSSEEGCADSFEEAELLLVPK